MGRSPQIASQPWVVKLKHVTLRYGRVRIIAVTLQFAPLISALNLKAEEALADALAASKLKNYKSMLDLHSRG